MSEQSNSEFFTSLRKKILAALIFGLEFSALFLLLGNGGNIPWLPPVLVFSIIGISLAASIVFPSIWHWRERKEKTSSQKIYGFLYGAIRYCTAFNVMAFGWKKFYGLQFIVPSEIAKIPMNQQGGEWLTWFYFGYSPAFGIIIAMIQIVGGIMLLYRKTLLAGTVILFSLLLNLTLINIFYDMNAGALMQSVLLTVGVLYLMLLDYKRLVNFFFRTRSNLPSIKINNLFLKNVLRLFAVLLSLLFTIYLKKIMV